MKRSLYVYLTQTEISDGYIASEVNVKKPNKAKLKKKLNKILSKCEHKVLRIQTIKMDVLELAKTAGLPLIK